MLVEISIVPICAEIEGFRDNEGKKFSSFVGGGQRMTNLPSSRKSFKRSDKERQYL